MLDLLWQPAHGCSFLVTSRNFTAAKLGYANSYLKLRGPDHTTHLHRGGVNFVHNLLWLTGRFTPQPFVSGPIVALFNGEIYNYREFGWAHFVTDGEALIPMYRKHGELFARQLRGEFSLVVADFERDILVLSTDVFGTKPFWVARGAGEWGVASYASGLSRLDFGGHRMRATQELEPNTIEVRRLSTFRLLRRHTLHEFDLRQHKHALDDWTAAFRAAMARRAATLQHGVFVGLSAGVDSGLIALRLTEMQVAHHLYSLDCHEQTSTIHRRHKFARAASRRNQPHGVETLSKETYQAALAWMDAHVEPFQYTQARRRGIQLAHDPGAVGLSYICSQAKATGLVEKPSAPSEDTAPPASPDHLMTQAALTPTRSAVRAPWRLAAAPGSLLRPRPK